MRHAGRLVAVAAALMAAGCTAGVPPATTSGAAPAVSPPARLARSHCPVTLPMPHASPPAKNLADVLPVPYGWYGNSALLVGLPARGVLPAGRTSLWPGEWGTKFPWWRLTPGILTITARRLDGPSAGFHGQVADGYGKLGFIPSGLIWPEPGCWQVTGTVSGHSLTIVVRVAAGHS
jgi:hypothetical protein